AARHGIPVEPTKESPYSIDQNLWGRSCESGLLEDPWDEPPADAFAWTVDPARAPNEPAYVTIDFEEGRPTALDGHKLDGVPLLAALCDGPGAPEAVQGQGDPGWPQERAQPVQQEAGDLRERRPVRPRGGQGVHSAVGPGAADAGAAAAAQGRARLRPAGAGG